MPAEELKGRGTGLSKLQTKVMPEGRTASKKGGGEERVEIFDVKRKILKESESKREFDRKGKKREARKHSSEVYYIYIRI